MDILGRTLASAFAVDGGKMAPISGVLDSTTRKWAVVFDDKPATLVELCAEDGSVQGLAIDRKWNVEGPAEVVRMIRKNAADDRLSAWLYRGGQNVGVAELREGILRVEWYV